MTKTDGFNKGFQNVKKSSKKSRKSQNGFKFRGIFWTKNEQKRTKFGRPRKTSFFSVLQKQIGLIRDFFKKSQKVQKMIILDIKKRPKNFVRF